jgi:hypothetical protein
MKLCWWTQMLTFLCCAVVAAAEMLKVCIREEGSQGLNPFCGGYLSRPRTYVILWSSNKRVYLHMPQHWGIWLFILSFLWSSKKFFWGLFCILHVHNRFFFLVFNFVM